MLRVVLVGLGTAGDVHPLIAIGRAMRARGHQVSVVTHGQLAARVERAGLAYVELATRDEYRAIADHPRVEDVRVAFRLLAERALVPLVPRLYRILADAWKPGETVVAAGGLAFGARLAQERLGMPLVTVHAHAVYLRSVHDGSVLPAALPKPLARLALRAVDAFVDRRVAGPVNAFRRELGLPPVTRLVNTWWNSPQAVMALFPAWFAPPQPDWPPRTQATGFALDDASDAAEVPDEARRFVESGEPPLVFSTASWMRGAAAFFAAGIEACRRLGRRGVVLTDFPEQLPRPLPEHVRHFPFLPFSWLLPRSAALVHHGGMGTLAQALAAGIPQLVSPINLDHPDNAARLARLGVARVLPPRRFRAAAAARALEEILGSPGIAARCRALALRVAGEDGARAACQVLEGVARAGTWPAAGFGVGPRLQ